MRGQQIKSDDFSFANYVTLMFTILWSTTSMCNCMESLAQDSCYSPVIKEVSKMLRIFGVKRNSQDTSQNHQAHTAIIVQG